jgi:hypothetical protein
VFAISRITLYLKSEILFGREINVITDMTFLDIKIIFQMNNIIFQDNENYIEIETKYIFNKLQ